MEKSWPGARTRQQALPFSDLQKRLGRKTVSEEMIRAVPVVYMAFDVLYAGGELLTEKPLEARRKILEQSFAAVPKEGFAIEYSMATENPQGKLVFEPTCHCTRRSHRHAARNPGSRAHG